MLTSIMQVSNEKLQLPWRQSWRKLLAIPCYKYEKSPLYPLNYKCCNICCCYRWCLLYQITSTRWMSKKGYPSLLATIVVRRSLYVFVCWGTNRRRLLSTTLSIYTKLQNCWDIVVFFWHANYISFISLNLKKILWRIPYPLNQCCLTFPSIPKPAIDEQHWVRGGGILKKHLLSNFCAKNTKCPNLFCNLV